MTTILATLVTFVALLSAPADPATQALSHATGIPPLSATYPSR